MSKKFIGLSIVILGFLIALNSCSTDPTGEFTLSVLAGPTGISMAEMLEEPPVYKEYQVVPRVFTSPLEIVPTMVTGESDIVAIPLNLGAKLYTAKGVNYSLVAITGTGMLQVITRDSSIQDFQDLENSTVYGAGQGGSPEVVYNILAKNRDIHAPLDFTYNAPSQLATALMEGLVDTALLPEPFVTLVLNRPDLSVVVDIQEEWISSVGQGETYPMTGIFISSEFLNNQPKVVNLFLDDLESSIQWVQENPEDAGAIVEEWGIMKSSVAEKAIPNLALTFITGDTAQSMATVYLNQLFLQDPSSVGGSLPDENFYWK